MSGFLPLIAPLRATAIVISMAMLSPETIWAQQPEFYDVPFAPGQWNIGRQLDESHLRYCVDRRDPDWELAIEIAETIAAGLLLEPQQYVVESGMVREDITKIYQILLEHCDVYMGFKLIPEGLPDWVTVTRPYYEARYVFVTDDPDIEALGDLAPSRPIAATLATSAHLQLLAYVMAKAPEDRWPVFPMGTSDLAVESLLNDTVDVAVIWGPSFWALARENPEIAELRVIDPRPLPPITLGVGGLLLSDQTYLRVAIDEAIAALTTDGTIAAVLENYDFATAAP